MKYIFSFVLISIIQLPLLSQKVLIEKDISKAYKNIKGPNTKSFGQVYFSCGIMVAESSDPGIQIKSPQSRYGSFGYRKKYKVSDYYAVGFETELLLRQFSLKQTDAKVFPNPVIHDKEKIKLSSVGLTLYNRINFGKRGNIIGRYIDIGGFVNYTFNKVHYTKDDISDLVVTPDTDVFAKTRVVKNSRLDYIQPFEYGIYARAGINHVAVKVNYRLSDLFKTKYNWAELPALYAGIELSIFN